MFMQSPNWHMCIILLRNSVFFFIIISTSLQGLWAGEDTTENQLKCTQMSDSAISSHKVEGGTEVTIAQFSVSSSIMILQLVESSADGTEPTNV